MTRVPHFRAREDLPARPNSSRGSVDNGPFALRRVKPHTAQLATFWGCRMSRLLHKIAGTYGSTKKMALPAERIERLIIVVRGRKVMLSTHLAELYDVEPRVLVQAVKRNLDRFPQDFMFQLSKAEFTNLKSQFVISNWGGLRRATPYAFTEQGRSYAVERA